MKPAIHSATWYELYANGNPRLGRYYCQDPDHPGYHVYELADETPPKNLREPPPDVDEGEVE